MKPPIWICFLGVGLFLAAGLSLRGDEKTCHHQKKGKKKTVAGKADVLRRLPKKFAAFVGYDRKNNTVRLQIEGEKTISTWTLRPAAEVKIHGWWGRPQQLHKGDRVWAWFALDRKQKPQGILMLADEISEQDIHGAPAMVRAINEKEKTVIMRSVRKKVRTLQLPSTLAEESIKVGGKLYVQSAGKKIRLLVSESQLEKLRNKQKDHLRAVWRKDGLPGMVNFLHPLGGEMEIMLDHESMRWGRYLKNGDKIKVTAAATKPITATVRTVTPWREFTRLTLVTNSGVDQLDLKIGQRVRALVAEPPKAVQSSRLPTDMDRNRPKEQRLEWFLASVYCTCRVKGDRCTGMFYTLASCNRNACGNPNMIRRHVSKMIDEGLNDRQICERLLKMRGPELLKQHLLK